ncbi:MAG: restriction endonuclease subunit S [Lewinella sp.]
MGWEMKKLEEVCNIKPPKKEAATLIGLDEKVSFVPMGDLGINEKHFKPKQERKLSDVKGSYTFFKEGDVLLAKITPCFENGKLGIAKGLTNGIGFGSSEFIPYRPTKELNASWLYYFLNRQSFRDTGADQMSGAVGHKRITKEFYQETQVPLPPLPEQKRLVHLLDTAFGEIERARVLLERNLRNAGELFESRLINILSKKRDDWQIKTLKEVCSIITDGTHQTPTYFDSGYVFLSSRNVKTGKIDWNNIKYIDEVQHQKMYGRLAPQIGDILLAKNGTTGVAAIVDVDRVFDIYVSLALLRPTAEIYPEFLLRFVNSPVAKKQFNSRLKGSGVPNLHLKEIREVRMAFPESLKKQEKVANEISILKKEVDKVREQYQAQLSHLTDLKQSLLARAFAGEL